MQETYIEEILKELTLEEKIGMIHGAGLFRTEGVERLLSMLKFRSVNLSA